MNKIKRKTENRRRAVRIHPTNEVHEKTEQIQQSLKIKGPFPVKPSKETILLKAIDLGLPLIEI